MTARDCASTGDRYFVMDVATAFSATRHPEAERQLLLTLRARSVGVNAQNLKACQSPETQPSSSWRKPGPS